jgi:superoxide dismutase
LKYLNKRADYVKAIWSAINWNTVNTRYAIARKDG